MSDCGLKFMQQDWKCTSEPIWRVEKAQRGHKKICFYQIWRQWNQYNKVLSAGFVESLHRAEISEWACTAHCKGQCLNRWHVITLSHSKRACPITRVKSSVQELRLPPHFAWSASRWDSRTKMQQGGSAVPCRSDFIGSQSVSHSAIIV